MKASPRKLAACRRTGESFRRFQPGQIVGDCEVLAFETDERVRSRMRSYRVRHLSCGAQGYTSAGTMRRGGSFQHVCKATAEAWEQRLRQLLGDNYLPDGPIRCPICQQIRTVQSGRLDLRWFTLNDDDIPGHCQSCGHVMSAGSSEQGLRALFERHGHGPFGARWIYFRYVRKRKECKQFGLVFAMTLADMPVCSGACPRCGQEFTPPKYIGKGQFTTGKRGPRTPELHNQRVPKTGYYSGEVVWMCRDCNASLQNRSAAELAHDVSMMTTPEEAVRLHIEQIRRLGFGIPVTQ